MRTTVTLDDELLKQAIKISGLRRKSELMNRALQAFIHRWAGRKVAFKYGGTMPGLKKEFNRDIAENERKPVRRS